VSATDLVIAKGGVHWGGDYTSVRVETDQPVTLRGTTIAGPGLLVTGKSATRLALVNCSLVGDGGGYAIDLHEPARLQVHCSRLTGTGGIRLHKAPPSARVTVMYNNAEKIARKDNLAQFIQLDKCEGLAEMRIIGNTVVNRPGESAVEDVISIYESSGRPDAPILIKNNTIIGAHPAMSGANYTGGGIMAGDGVQSRTRYVLVEYNAVMGSINHGIAIASGRDIVVRHNVVKDCGIGLYVWNLYKAKDFGGHRVDDNWVRCVKDGKRNDAWFPDLNRVGPDTNHYLP